MINTYQVTVSLPVMLAIWVRASLRMVTLLARYLPNVKLPVRSDASRERDPIESGDERCLIQGKNESTFHIPNYSYKKVARIVYDRNSRKQSLYIHQTPAVLGLAWVSQLYRSFQSLYYQSN